MTKKELFAAYINGTAAEHRIRQCGIDWATNEMKIQFKYMARGDILEAVKKRHGEIFK